MEDRTELSFGYEILMTSRNKNHPFNKPIIRGYGLIEVREGYCTVYAGHKRYQNIDTGKFDTDRIKTLNSFTLNDLTLDEHEDNWINPYVRQANRDKEEIQKTSIIYKFPKFVPKDDDFDREIECQKQLSDTEKKLDEDRMIYLGGPLNGQKVCNVKKNSWKPK